eukprot:12429626-Ditylum_brightwellii.AAC.1
MSLSAEAVIGALYNNTRQGEELQMAPIKMGHPQPQNPIMIDNSTLEGMINIMYWRPRSEKYGDYPTKHHSAPHHRRWHPTVLHEKHPVAYQVKISQGLQGYFDVCGISALEVWAPRGPSDVNHKTDVTGGEPPSSKVDKLII